LTLLQLKKQITEIVNGKTYCIKNNHTGKCLSLSAAFFPITVDTCNCSNIYQQNKLYFNASKAQWTILNNNMALNIDKSDAGSRIVWGMYFNTDNQQLSFIYEPETNSYVMKSNWSNKCIEIKDNNISNGSPIQTNYCTNAMSQVWTFIPLN